MPTKCFFLRLILQHFILVFTTCFSYFDVTPFYFRFYTFFLCLYNLLNSLVGTNGPPYIRERQEEENNFACFFETRCI